MVGPANASMAHEVGRFNPQAVRKWFVGESGLDFLASTRFDPSHPMGNVASHQVGDFVSCTLLGLYPQLATLAPVRLDWLNDALRRDEQFGQSQAWHRATLSTAKGVCQWLLLDPDASHSWAQALDAHEQAMFEPGVYLQRDIAILGLDDFMLLSLLSNQAPRGIAMYERLRGAVVASPAMLRSKKPRDWGVLACHQLVNASCDRDDLHAAGRKMLRAHLDREWLGCGQYKRAAMWLLAVHGLTEPTLTPTQVLLRAYDDLPGIEAPPGTV